jgi:serine protease Do
VITELEGLVLSTDGTMSDYCDILRSRHPGDPLATRVLRFDTEEVLEGTLNGDEELTLAFSFAQELGDDVEGTTTGPYEFVEVFDNDGILVMHIPTVWTDVDGRGWDIGGEIHGPGIAAAPSLEGFYSTWTTPGVFFGASESLLDEIAPGDLLEQVDFSDSCTYDGRNDYQDEVYAGAYDVWLDCDGTPTGIVVLEAYPEPTDFVVFVQIQVVRDADLAALDTILATFDVVSG